MCSPRPVASAVPPFRQNGTSEPTRAPIDIRVSSGISSSYMLFNASSAAAASALPPAEPRTYREFAC